VRLTDFSSGGNIALCMCMDLGGLFWHKVRPEARKT
jgi:hypothetical protein